MGAVAGMSGSPLYIGGKLAGALSYQIQRFETVRYAGFTPAADLAEVRDKPDLAPANLGASPVSRFSAFNFELSNSRAASSGYVPLRPVFTLSGLAPERRWNSCPTSCRPRPRSFLLGGSTLVPIPQRSTRSSQAPSRPPFTPAGSAVAVALATGDITLAGTGTVARVDGNRVTAFGHPMMLLGNVELPLVRRRDRHHFAVQPQLRQNRQHRGISAPSRQDRLSAVSGTLGAGPARLSQLKSPSRPQRRPRTLRFQVARQTQLTPLSSPPVSLKPSWVSNDGASLPASIVSRHPLLADPKPLRALAPRRSASLCPRDQPVRPGSRARSAKPLREDVPELGQLYRRPPSTTQPGRQR